MRAEQQTEDRLSEKVAEDRTLFFFFLSLLRPSLRLEAPGECRRLAIAESRIRPSRRGGPTACRWIRTSKAGERASGSGVDFPVAGGRGDHGHGPDHGAPGSRRGWPVAGRCGRSSNRAAGLDAGRPCCARTRLECSPTSSWMERGTAATTNLNAAIRAAGLSRRLRRSPRAHPELRGRGQPARERLLGGGAPLRFPSGRCGRRRACGRGPAAVASDRERLPRGVSWPSGRAPRACGAGDPLPAPVWSRTLPRRWEPTCRRIAELAETYKAAAKWSAERERLAVRVADRSRAPPGDACTARWRGAAKQLLGRRSVACGRRLGAWALRSRPVGSLRQAVDAEESPVARNGNLVVDDDGHIREVVRFALEKAGHRVAKRPTAREALAPAPRAAGRPRRARHHHARAGRPRGLPHGCASAARCRSSSSPAATRSSTACSASRSAPTTTSPSRSARASWSRGSRRCCGAPRRGAEEPEREPLRRGELTLDPQRYRCYWAETRGDR